MKNSSILVQVAQQHLSPQQLLLTKLLELPVMQLEQRIDKEVEENPLLEKEEQEGDNNISVEDYVKASDGTTSYRSYNYSADNSPLVPQIAVTSTFQDHIIEQLGYHNLTEQELTIATFIVGCIDEDGYLRTDPQTISDDILVKLSLDVPAAQIERLIDLITHTDPVGFGSKNLQQFLSLQLENSTAEYAKLAKQIIDRHFDTFVGRKYDRLMVSLGVDKEELGEAIDLIRSLSPRPANGIGGQVEDNPTIVPDFIIAYQNDHFEITLTRRNRPNLKINNRYAEQIKSMVATTQAEQKDAMQFLKEKSISAQRFIDAIAQRNDTLLKIIKAIVARQKDYFVSGDRENLRPMILKNIAEETELVISTVSRVVNSKSALCPWGVVLLKSLFTEGMTKSSGEEVSVAQVKSILKQTIDNEDKLKPLTDEQLATILAQKGYKIARRTVVKYRESLNYPPARFRKTI